MSKWSANFVNDPSDDYNIILEILCDDEDIALVKRNNNELVLKWYASKKDIAVPLDWFLGLLKRASEGL